MMTTEKIRQLAEQSANEIADLFSTGFFNDRMVNDVAEINKKFAELIVRECIAQVRKDENGPAYEAVGRIAEHFGIE
jgi:hypothetical protein